MHLRGNLFETRCADRARRHLRLGTTLDSSPPVRWPGRVHFIKCKLVLEHNRKRRWIHYRSPEIRTARSLFVPRRALRTRTAMKIPALKVNQWLDLWNEVKFDAKKLRARPSEHFYLFTLRAQELRRLSGIYPRVAHGRTRATDDLGIQRRHDAERSDEISAFIRFGHPWAGLSKAQRSSSEYADLKKPGWLPTAIVVNILKDGDVRGGKKIAAPDVIRVAETEDGASVTLPAGFPRSDWEPSGVPPIEVIDGQHRLWAFSDDIKDGKFQLPVVAFQGLDISWQAYLFYTINIKPKRITASLAFDLYPLLRTEDWLEKFEGPVIYRETRAQELVDLLYSHPLSPWCKRINMLGESGLGRRMVSQAAWVRSLLATFVKHWEGKHISIGGLFGAPVGKHEQVLPWSRYEQGAFLIAAGECFQKSVKTGKEKWQKALRASEEPNLFADGEDSAFSGSNSLIAQDQGIRAFLSVVNDLCFLSADRLKLSEWGRGGNPLGAGLEIVTSAVKSLKGTKIQFFLGELGDQLAKFDWRASSAPGLSPEESLMKAAFRGSGGYRELRRQILLELSKSKGDIGSMSQAAIKQLGYE
jgi:DGQHR domain-containing protein